MSTLQVSNLHFESTGNNRIHITSGNTVTFVANGVTQITSNSSTVVVGSANNIVANSTFITFNTDFTGSFIANTSNFRSATANKILNTSVWDAAAEVTLTDAATIVVNMAIFLNATVTLGGNRTLGQPSSTKVGQSGVIRIVQDATGSRTLAYHADWEFAGGTPPVLSTAANAQDLLFYQVLAANRIFGSLVKGVV